MELNLFLLGFSHHVTCHIPDRFVYDFSHGGHNTLCLFAFETFTLETLNEVVCVEMEVVAGAGAGKGACVE